MSLHRNIGNIMVTHPEIYFEWKIADFITIIEDESFSFCKSPVFSFAGVPCYMQYSRKSVRKSECMILCLRSHKLCRYRVKYNLGLRRIDNNVEQIFTGILRIYHAFHTDIDCCFIKRSEILQRKSQLAPSDVLTVTCRLKCGKSHSSKRNVLNNPKLKTLIKLETLSENFKNILHNKETCDVILHVMDKEYKAHKIVLIARSPVFSAMFQHNTSEKQTGIVTIPDCDPESFEMFLKFLYCGKLEELSPSHALHLYETSEKYNVQELKTFCSEYLMETLSVENFCDVVIAADKYDDEKLLSAVQCFFNNNLNKVLVTSEWDYLLTNARHLANKLLLEMSKNVKVVENEKVVEKASNSCF